MIDCLIENALPISQELVYIIEAFKDDNCPLVIANAIKAYNFCKDVYYECIAEPLAFIFQENSKAKEAIKETIKETIKTNSSYELLFN